MYQLKAVCAVFLCFLTVHVKTVNLILNVCLDSVSTPKPCYVEGGADEKFEANNYW